MFELDQFIFDCRAAVRQKTPQSSVRETVARAVADPAAVLKALGEPDRGKIKTLHRSDDLTILNVIWAPWMTLLPHNHLMWAVIGIYTGREDNIFWRRLPGGTGSRVEAAGAKEQASLEPPENEKTYPEPSMFGHMPAYGFFIRHVKGIEFSGVTVGWLSEDLRPAFLLNQVRGAYFSDVKAQHARMCRLTC